MTDTIHPFEAANLGKAPFHFTGYEIKTGPIKLADGTEIGYAGQPMGTCNFCGQGIAICCGVKSSDGRAFVVGIDCVEKIERSDNRTTTAKARDPLYQSVKKAKREHARKVRHKREAAFIAEGAAWMEQHRADLEKMPGTREGESRWQQFEWYMAHAGNAGKISIIKHLRKVVTESAIA